MVTVMPPWYYFPLNWGSVPEWVAAVAAVGAVIGAIVSLAFSARAVRLSTEANQTTANAFKADVIEREQAQARFVYALTDETTVVEPGYVFNPMQYGGASSFTSEGEAFVADVVPHTGMYKAKHRSVVATITIHNRSQELIGPLRVGLYDKSTGNLIGSMTVGASGIAPPLLPGKTVTYKIGTAVKGSPQARAELRFRDSSGRWWRRRDYDPIERISTEEGEWPAMT